MLPSRERAGESPAGNLRGGELGEGWARLLRSLGYELEEGIGEDFGPPPLAPAPATTALAGAPTCQRHAERRGEVVDRAPEAHPRCGIAFFPVLLELTEGSRELTELVAQLLMSLRAGGVQYLSEPTHKLLTRLGRNTPVSHVPLDK